MNKDPQTSIENLIEALKTADKGSAFEALRRAIADEFRSDLYLCAKYLCGYKDVTWSTHCEIIEALEAPTKRKLIIVPRDCFKSSIAVVSYTIWLLINDFNKRILIDSEVYTNSKNFLREIKSIAKSDLFMLLFGDPEAKAGPKAVWTEGEIIFEQRTTSKKEASVTCSGIGAGKTGQHYDVIIGDDYNTHKNSSSVEGQQAVISHWRSQISVLDSKVGVFVLIGTRYAANDIAGFVLREILNLPELSEGEFPKGLLSELAG